MTHVHIVLFLWLLFAIVQRLEGPGYSTDASDNMNSDAELNNFEELLRMWDMHKNEAASIEEVAYRQVQAPPGVAPRTRKPLSLSSEMSAHHWVNFTKVYGKYLLSLKYSGAHLEMLSLLLDFAGACLRSRITPGELDRLRDQARLVAERMHGLWPPTERPVTLHLLLFHMVDILAFAGPSRGYHVWAFERSGLQTVTFVHKCNIVKQLFVLVRFCV